MDAGYHTVESIAYTYVPLIPGYATWPVEIDISSRPKRLLEQIKGISEQKATKVLVEGELSRPFKSAAAGVADQGILTC